ncbi:Forkhead box protein P3 [Anabarilius grahami]|uniref:Forkhead box protein P3 n=1 Tax=Anabarilius grahami TaxID=495550 RepID=A0A3N0YS09_ANAGA|nr:Forkhead box protein P3 [Anabarilius grahami]
MPQSERESDKRVSGRENERQPQLKEERDASPPLISKRSSPQCVEDLSPAVRSNSAPQTVAPVQLSHTAPSNNSAYLKHPLCQRAGDEERMHFLQLVFQNSRAGQIRPSVLRSTALLLQANDSHSAAMNRRKDTGHGAQISIQAVAESSQHRKQSPSLHHHSPVQTEMQRSSSLYVNGQCRWPGCDKVFEEYTHFLRHLNLEHSTDEKTIAQWRVQQDLVHHMENQLIQEKQKLHAMQIHLQLFECISTCTGVASGRSRPLALNLPPLGEPDGRTERASEAPVRQEPWHIPPPHLLPGAYYLLFLLLTSSAKQVSQPLHLACYTTAVFITRTFRRYAAETEDAAQQNFLCCICNLSHLDVVRRVTFERMKERLSSGKDERALASILASRRDDLTAGHRSSLMPPDSSGLSTTFKL